MAAILELDEHLNKSFKVRSILMYPQLACIWEEKGVCSDHGRATLAMSLREAKSRQ